MDSMAVKWMQLKQKKKKRKKNFILIHLQSRDTRRLTECKKEVFFFVS